MFIDFRERGREREREKHRSAASGTRPDQELNPQPRFVPWLGIKPALTNWATWPGRQPSFYNGEKI